MLATSEQPVVFDRTHALRRLGGLHDLLRDVLTLMVTETPKVHAQIAAAFARGDSDGLKHSAHTLRGSMSLVGATDMVRRLKRIEETAQHLELSEASQEIEEIGRQFTELQLLLSAELGLS